MRLCVQNKYKNGNHVTTKFELSEQGNKLFLTITPPSDDKGLLPSSRVFYINVRDIVDGKREVVVGDKPLVIEFNNVIAIQNENVEELKSAILTRVQGRNDRKTIRYRKSFPAFVKNALWEFDSMKY